MKKNSKIKIVEPENATRFIKGYITEQNPKGKERTWGAELVTGHQIKIRDNRFYWFCTEIPEDLDYDCPPRCWNYHAPASSPSNAKKWFFKTYRIGDPSSEEGWVTNEVVVVEAMTSNSQN